MRALFLGALCIVAVFAGCVEPGEKEGALPTDTPKGPPPDAWAMLRGLLAGLPCEAPFTGSATTENLERVANVTYENGDHAELDAKGNLLAHSNHGQGGFELLNISDPLMPRLLSSVAGSRGTSLDVKLMPDLSAVMVGVTAGVDVWDIRDPEEPVLELSWDWPSTGVRTNAHMIYLYDKDNQTYLFIAPEDNRGVWILEVGGEPGAHTITLIAKAAENVNGPLGPHDMWATYDADLDAHVLYIANGFLGWLAYDISDPASPVKLGGMVNPDAHQGYLHTIQAAKVGNRRLVTTISEVGVNAMRVFDATDLANPIPLGSWTFEYNPASWQHNLQIANGTLYFSHYENGVFAFDLHDVGTMPYGQTQQLVPIAHYDVDSSSWDVVIKDGLLWVGDSNKVHIVGFGCNTVGDPLATSTG